MTDQFDHIHRLTNDHLAKRLQEYARRHVDEEKEVYLKAARRLTSVTIYPSDLKPMDKRPCPQKSL